MKIAISLFCFLALGSYLSVKIDRPALVANEEISFRKHAELGDVHWNRSLEHGLSLAKSSGKPVFLLFQEIPGCQTCQNYGAQPLSHPLLVEAIEELFVPVAIFNNKPGADAEILKRFNEREWNNPVVRYLDASSSDLIPRKDGVWSIRDTTERIGQALEKTGKKTPAWLRLIVPTDSKIEIAEFAMHCYWEGEAKLGGLEGVHTTRSAWRGDLEVVQLLYSPETIDYKTLLEKAQSFECASKVFAHTDDQFRIANALVPDRAARATGNTRDAKSSDQLYYLKQTPLRHLPLTSLQATKINALVKQRQPVDPILSPRQLQLLKQIRQVLSQNRSALSDYTFPADQQKLSAYHRKLAEELQRISKEDG